MSFKKDACLDTWMFVHIWLDVVCLHICVFVYIDLWKDYTVCCQWFFFFNKKFISDYYTRVKFFRKSICCFSHYLISKVMLFMKVMLLIYFVFLQQCLQCNKNSAIFADNSTRFKYLNVSYEAEFWFWVLLVNCIHSVAWPESVFLMLYWFVLQMWCCSHSLAEVQYHFWNIWELVLLMTVM